MSERVATGIYGLDELIGGGFRKNTVNIVHGGIGVGKTTFCLQYALFGLNRGEKVVFISFEMTKEQILRDAKELGLNEIEEHIELGNLEIIHIYGEDLTFPPISLVDILEINISDKMKNRIIIDPLTHYSMFLDEEKRKSLSTIFQSLREFGTTIITLEESHQNDAINTGYLMPLYLADTVLHLDNLGFGELFDRTLRVAKHRGSKHGEGLYPYKIESGIGIIILASEHDIEKVTPTNEFDGQFIAAIEKAARIDVVGEKLVRRIELLRKDWNHSESPEYILDLITRDEMKH
ncbi:MAG: ATPase domain-containing protein [ANME-2 cluster archaeon]|nr:ATPase domain-containing protein [ANME-2 cluster archaeon]